MSNNIANILQQGESQTVEFKTSFNKEVIETIVAFSNTKGGKIYLGINDKKEIVGVQLSDESIQNWLNEIKQSTQPAVFPDFNVIETDNKTVVEIVVDEFPLKPIAYKNRYFSRKQNSNHLLSTDEIAEMRFVSISDKQRKTDSRSTTAVWYTSYGNSYRAFQNARNHHRRLGDSRAVDACNRRSDELCETKHTTFLFFHRRVAARRALAIPFAGAARTDFECHRA
ncbi:MAG: ATP-binding protein [Candidatus Symbiothrix sp.]|jgi:predicted HTH transcriptional regulator|nr:ATP-binding protein [Candidatus Symbiothrix sp.]